MARWLTRRLACRGDREYRQPEEDQANSRLAEDSPRPRWAKSANTPHTKMVLMTATLKRVRPKFCPCGHQSRELQTEISCKRRPRRELTREQWQIVISMIAPPNSNTTFPDEQRPIILRHFAIEGVRSSGLRSIPGIVGPEIPQMPFEVEAGVATPTATAFH